MAKDPAFLFYPGDFSTGTQFFTDEQVGKYVRLLMAQHQHGHLNENQVIHICKSYDNHIMLKFKKDSGGLWYNERLEIEIDKRKNYVDSRGKNKQGKTKTKIISKSYDIHMENRNENRNENEDWLKWSRQIVEDNDPHWGGRKVGQAEMDNFLSVATRNEWSMPSQGKFRTTLMGFNPQGHLNALGKTQTKVPAFDIEEKLKQAKGK